MSSSSNGERRPGCGKLADIGVIAAEGFIDVQLISAFGPHLSLESRACDFAWRTFADGRPAEISGPPPRAARQLDRELNVVIDTSGTSDKMMIIADAVDVALREADVQEAGINPLGLGGGLLVSVILAVMCGRRMREQEVRNCLEPIAADRDVNFYEEGSLLSDIKQEIETRNDATPSTRISDQRGGVESIHLGIFLADGGEHAACIIMDAPSRGESLYMSSFPPSLKNPVIDENTTRSTNSSFPALDPHEYWRRGEPPPINCIQIESAWMNIYFNEYRKNFKTLHTPQGMTVHQYAVEILRKAHEYKTMCPNTEDERKQGLVCYSKRLLSTILEGAGGVTARLDMSEFRKELEMVTPGLPNSENESKVIPGIGEPFPSPWQTQDSETRSPERKRPGSPRGLL
ncbi:MAG TPA: hypothetical protein VGZ00_09105 [Candidatus Baltobacteraceae bacterium]|jgi:hypothetical protein|nr:hypothetical protein [Candidatus Baltobacteraceae bacterium]